MSVIELSKVSKTFKGTTLFEDINYNFEKGKIYGIVGPNGSGKSVLFKLICNFISPDKGTINISPEFKATKYDFPKNFGVIIDRPGYIANKTGLQNLKLLADIQGTITEEQIKSTMKMLGLNPDAPQKVKNYSLGMKQKLAIAQAVMENQEVLILDEPFNALDAKSVELLRTILLTYKSEGKTILLTSHNQEDIDILADYVLMINNYQIQELKK